MAIFKSKQDAALPLITQLMQVDLNDPNEVKAFWERTVVLARSQNAFVLSLWLAPPSPVDILETKFDAQIAEKMRDADAAARLMDEFKTACQRAQHIFQSLFEQKAVPLNDLTALRYTFPTGTLLEFSPDLSTEAISQHKKAVEWALDVGDDTSEFYAPLSSFMSSYRMGHVLPGYYLASEVEDKLWHIWQGGSRLCACCECENIFVTTRKEAVFCSHRCANANGTRRRRAERKAPKEKTNVA